MYNYRLATPDDLETLLRMGEQFHREQIEPILDIPYDFDSATMAAFDMMDNGVLVVAVVDPDGTALGDEEFGKGPVVGMLGVSSFPYRFNQAYRIAKEEMFWIDPEHRGQRLAAELVAVTGIGAGADGVDYSAMVALESSPSHVAGLYKALGYRPLETTYIRKVTQED